MIMVSPNTTSTDIDTIKSILDNIALKDNLSQERVIISHLTGALSMIGSCTIIYIIVSDFKKRISCVYGRLLLMMSIFDVFFSIAHMLSSIPIPRDKMMHGSRGNTQTCEMQGFLLQLGIAVPLYNASLCFYFLLRLRYNVSEKTIAQKIEPFMHIMNVGFAMGSSVASLLMGLFNRKGTLCWIESYPWGCDFAPGLECTKGENSPLFEIIFGVIPIGCSYVVVMCSMVAIYLYIRRKEKLVRRSSNSNAANEARINLLSAEKKQTAILASLFVGAFFITYSIPVVVNVFAIFGVHYTHWIVYTYKVSFYHYKVFGIL